MGWGRALLDCMLSSITAVWNWGWTILLAILAIAIAMGVGMAQSVRLRKWVVRRLAWVVSQCLYRIRVVGLENVPCDGGGLLASNHVSWIDGLLVIYVCPRPVRMLVDAGNLQNRLVRGLASDWDAVLMTSSPKSIGRALREARQSLQSGKLVGVFPEGGITRTGATGGFRPGLLKILEGTNAPVIPVFLDGLWGSIFSFERGRFFWKWPRRWPYPITVYFGRPVRKVEDIEQVRQAVLEVGAVAMKERLDKAEPLPITAIRMCKRRRFRRKLADSTGAELTGGSLLMRALILRRLLHRGVLAPDEAHVAILLPPSAGAVVVNLAVALDRRVAVNLNYTLTSDVLNRCLERARIRHVLTSRKFMEKTDFQLNTQLVFLDDLRDQVSWQDKLVCGLAAYAVPVRLVAAWLRLERIRADCLLTVIFTSGSTGDPKGVMLTCGNIAHNVQAVDQVIHLTRNDVIVGVLPFFHSFGYTVTLWTVVALDIAGVYHFNPLDARQVGKLCAKYKGTVLLATPTFLRGYVRRCDPEDLSTVNTVVAGAEKLPKELCDAFEAKFGVRPVEGYGATELAPLVSVNIPPSRSVKTHQIDCKEGTVGRVVPGVVAKVVDLETEQRLGPGQPGMLLVTGPNVMKGYLDQPDKTAEVIRDGWYVTGDIAQIDEHGFITITGRESRFSKIGGEMVPHVQIEETLQKVLGADEDTGPLAAVTAVPDNKKGERLVVVHRPLTMPVDAVREKLREQGLPNLYIPSADSFVQVEELPVLGTGKLDLKGIQQIACQRLHVAAS